MSLHLYLQGLICWLSWAHPRPAPALARLTTSSECKAGEVVVYARSVISALLQRGVPFTSSNNPSCMCDVTNR